MFKYIILAVSFASVYTLSCGIGEYQNGQYCNSCASHCNACMSASFCVICENGFSLDVTSHQCIRQTIANCITIDGNAIKVCKQCDNGYWLKSDKNCYANTLSGCNFWQNEVEIETCLEAQSGYYLQNGIPKACPINCMQCSNSFECTTCADGYYKSNKNVCTAKLKKCLTWKEYTDTIINDEECQECPTGYTLLNKQCYISSCIYSKNNSMKCGGGKTRESMPFCHIPCADPYCQDCINSMAGTCQQCIPGFLLFSGSCYYKSGDLANCATLASATICVACDDTYHFYNYRCAGKVIVNCNSYSDETTCNACNDGYVLINNECKACTLPCATCQIDSTTCLTCINGKFLNINKCDVQCLAQHCAQCSQTDIIQCVKCEDGYALESNACANVCTAPCKTCSASQTTCTSCIDGYWFNQTAVADDAYCAIRCQDGCKTCDDTPDICTKCDSQYHLTNTGNCILYSNIIKNCNQMDTDITCKTCASNYYISRDQTQCVQCDIFNCIECNNDGTSCYKCADGYGLEESNIIKKVCVQCSQFSRYNGDNCPLHEKWRKFPYRCENLTDGCAESNPTPIIGEASLDCKSCNNGYKLDLSTKSCIPCPNNCLYCASNTCNQCERGYYLKISDYTCVKCHPTCSQCTNTECIDCQEGYGFALNELDEQTKCYQCEENCAKCDRSNACIQCMTGFYLHFDQSSSKCLACSIGCQDCDDETQCYSCQKGYYLEDFICRILDEENNQKTTNTYGIYFFYSVLIIILIFIISIQAQ